MFSKFAMNNEIIRKSQKLMLLLLLLFAVSFSVQAEETVISDGVYIRDVSVGGLTGEQAEAVAEQQLAQLGAVRVNITMGEYEISTTLSDLGLTWTNPEIIEEMLEPGSSGNIIRRYKEKKDLQNENVRYEISYTLDNDAKQAFIEGLSQYNSEPVEGSVYMGDDGYLYTEGGTDGYELKVEETLGTLNEYLAEWPSGDISLEAEYTRSSPYLSADMIADMNHILGTATTDYSASSEARATNIVNGTSKISGTLLMPGESFSVTDAVVPFSAENGYELAPSYEAGQVVESYGGGICQVSTTLYNAVLKAELEVDARSNHTMTVSYVDPSKDAAIAEGVMDLVFTNTLDTPVYIYGSAYWGTLTFTIYGKETRPEGRTLEFVSEVLSRTDMSSSVTLVANTSQPAGYINQTQTAHEGVSAVLWKNVYQDGVLQETTQVNSSYYQATAAIYEIGVVTDNTTLQSALYSAIAAGSLTQVQEALTSATTPATEAAASADTADAAAG